MTLQEFEVFGPIINRWKRAYSRDQLNLVFDEVKSLEKSDLERIVKHLLGSCRLAPMVPDFRKSILELGIRAKTGQDSFNHPRQYNNAPDELYQIRGNIWANNNYIFIRGKDVRVCGFIIKANHPDHPLVKEDREIRNEKRLDAPKSVYQTAKEIESRMQSGVVRYLKTGDEF